jgi:hypothetical protein
MGSWKVLLHDDFVLEVRLLEVGLQDELFAFASLLSRYGPHLGRPQVDTLKASAFPNMKELRFNWMGGVWRVAFAFDPQRQAILLVVGDKRGVDQARFYKRLIRTADARYASYLGGGSRGQIT